MTAPPPSGDPQSEAEDFTRDTDLSRDELIYLLELDREVEASPPRFAHELAGRYLSQLFEKPTLRTRLTFERAIKQLGGDSILTSVPSANENHSGCARNLDRGPTRSWRDLPPEGRRRPGAWSKVP